MGRSDVARLPTGALFMTQLAADRGMDPAACLAGTGLSPERLCDPNAVITMVQELSVVTNVLDGVGDVPGLGLEVGTKFRLSAYGIWGFALISCATARAAVDLGMQFIDLAFSLAEIRFRQVDGEAQLVLTSGHLAPPLRRFALEREAAGMRTLHTDVLAVPPPIKRLSFAFPAPPDEVLPRYEEIFGVLPEFAADETVMAFDERVLDLPLPQANPVTKALALDQCRALLDERRARAGLVGQVRDLILDRLGDPVSSAQVAASLHMSDRYLRRRLAAAGTSFRALVEEVRERMAEELLATGMSVAEVSRHLGYMEVSSFSQAFRRWKGLGPRAYRTSRLAG